MSENKLNEDDFIDEWIGSDEDVRLAIYKVLEAKSVDELNLAADAVKDAISKSKYHERAKAALRILLIILLVKSTRNIELGVL